MRRRFCCSICERESKNFHQPCAYASARRFRRFAHACIARNAQHDRVASMFEARFQTFDDSSERAQSAARVAELRAEMKRRGVDGFVVPRADRHQNEYLPASEERLAWLTGFTGSAGTAVILADRAALFIDGRYTVQAN